MRVIRTSIFPFILIAFTCSLLSCDAFEYGSLLYRILRKLKFRVTEISAIYPAHLDRYDVLFLHDLNKAPTETEIHGIQDFVSTGGTLIIAGDKPILNELLHAYGLKLRGLSKRLEFSRRMPDEPFFPQHPINEMRTSTYFAIETLERDAVEFYGVEGDAVVVTLRDGLGRVYFIASSYLFHKDGLRYDGNSTFLYNLMSTLPPNARIGLAEKRYYTVDSKRLNPFTALMFGTPFGLGVVYICFTLFIFLVLRGRRFGKPLEVHERNRRLSSEYVHAMTALYQKGNTRKEILKHIREKFKTDLGNRWRVNPTLETSTFYEELVQRGAIDEDRQLVNLLTELEPSSSISERQLLDLAKRVEVYREAANIRKTNLTARRNFYSD